MKLLAMLAVTAFLDGAHAAAQISNVDPVHSAARRAVPADVDDARIAVALANGLKHPNGSAVAIVIPRADASLILVLIRQQDGTYVAADASQVETANFGVLGRKRREYEKYETIPVEWLPRDDGLLQVVMRTRAWREGQRYTMGQPLLIRPNGTVLYR